MQQISTAQDTNTRKGLVSRVADIPGGVSLDLTNLVAGSIVLEGTPLTAPSSGKRTVCKQAQILTGSDTSNIKVTSGQHHFKVGDPITVSVGGKAYDISSITTSNGVDTLVVGTPIDTPTVGAFVYEAAAEAASGAALANDADVVMKGAFEAPATSPVIFKADAIIIGTVYENVVGAAYLSQLKTINVVKY